MIPLGAFQSGVTAFSSALWGAWSVAIISMEPFRIPSRISARSAAVLNGGFIFAIAPWVRTALSSKEK